jgi:hypothetical protein
MHSNAKNQFDLTFRFVRIGDRTFSLPLAHARGSVTTLEPWFVLYLIDNKGKNMTILGKSSIMKVTFS